MTLAELLAKREQELQESRTRYDGIVARMRGITTTAREEGRDKLTALEQRDWDDLATQMGHADQARTRTEQSVRELQQATAEDQHDTRAAEAGEETPAGRQARTGQAVPDAQPTERGYDKQIRVTSEERTYAAHKERGFDSNAGKFRRGVKPGADFEFDVAAAFLGDYDAQDRLRAHMREEKVERGEYLSRASSDPKSKRAVGTGAFAGLTVPQYLTDLYAPATSAKRPLADAMNHHDLPAQGMTVNISRITTSTSVALQATENSAVSNTDIDDTLLTISVQTNAGQQTMSRQSIERGAGTEPVVVDDLYRRYAASLDSTLINQATTGLSAAATSITYTDASPTVLEFMPLVSQGAAAVEAALLDMASGDTIAVMNSRRWFWLNQALSATWPLMSQPNTLSQTLGANFAEVYGRGLRGILPNNIPALVDANVPINLGGGTNQDEVYLLDRQEAHLWEDPDAPLFIRAEQPAAASLGVLLVLYGYFAYTFGRMPHAQKISGTGLITPTWTGV